MRIVSVVTPVTGDGVACAYLAQTWESLAAQVMPSGWAWQWVVQFDGHPPRCTG